MTVLLPLHVHHMRAAGLARRTIRDRTLFLTRADKDLPRGIDTPTADELAEFLGNETWAPWTRCTYFNHIAGFYLWATTSGHIDWNPTLSLKRPKTPDADPDPVTDDELAQAIARSNDWWRLAITCAAYAGLRASEIGRLAREQVNAEFLTVRMGKGGKTKKLPTHPEIWKLVEPSPPGPLFVGPRGGRVDLTKTEHTHFVSIGMPDVHMHRFRSWYATTLLRQGADVRVVQELLRHATLGSVQRYTLVVDGQRRFAVGTLPVPTASQQDAA